MAEVFGSGVSKVYDTLGYNYDTVIFQKEKPILDSELNLVQQTQNIINQRQVSFLPSGWLSLYPIFADKSVDNSFYTQNPTGALPEYALVNGVVVDVRNTGTKSLNANLINLLTAPTSGNIVDGIFLEVWRALISPSSNDNKPGAETVIDPLNGIYMANESLGWMVGNNGLVIGTQNGGLNWAVQLTNTTVNLHSVFFANSFIGWIVGDAGTIGRTSSGGGTWTLIESNTNENLRSVWAFNQLTAWIVGDSGTILKTTNGITWLPQTSGVTTGLNRVVFFDAARGWAVGNQGVILKTTDGGTTWRLKTSGTSQNLNGVYFSDANYGFAVGNGGTILRTSDGGETWVSQSNNVFNGTILTTTASDLKDVYIAPNLDISVQNEEVSAQLDGTNKNFVTMNKPITLGNGTGTTTNDPTKVTVTVNGVVVSVATLNGATGEVILDVIPGKCATVLVSYYYKQILTTAPGYAWIVGSGGVALRSTDIGSTWVIQTGIGTAYDLNGVDFINKEKGWICANSSIIKYTDTGDASGQTTWTSQLSGVFSRIVQRVYDEGNLGTLTYLTDNSIHPDANVETTKRVQIQYQIRVVNNADPFYPDAGLGSPYVFGKGPNTTEKYAFENMGPSTGDYGLWRAKCENTVDGYVWAIPMFFVNRRNSSNFDFNLNPNGTTNISANIIRPDLLTEKNIVTSDIIDVRRRVVLPSVTELLNKNLDNLLSNNLTVKYEKKSTGGDIYGSKLLQLDRVGGSTSDGGDLISTSLTLDANGKLLSTAAAVSNIVISQTATTLSPTEYDFGLKTDGLYHPNQIYYSAKYSSGSPSNNNQNIPGYFEGIGTNHVKFIYGKNALTTISDPNLINYVLSLKEITTSGTGLSFVPNEPGLTVNYSGTTKSYFHGIKNSDSSKIVDTWDSSIVGHPNYVSLYFGQSSDNYYQRHRASTMELHYIQRFDGTATNFLTLPQVINNYTINNISKIYNRNANFTYKVKNLNDSSGTISIETASGYEFINGAQLEIVSDLLDATGNYKAGASVNFVPQTKELGPFYRSSIYSTSVSGSPTAISFTGNNETFLGVSSTETIDSTAQYICWYDTGTSLTIKPITGVSGWDTTVLTLTVASGTFPVAGNVHIQTLNRKTVLPYTAAGSGLLTGYYHIPHQSESSLPDSLDIEIVEEPKNIYISNIGTGGSTVSTSFNNPIEHIPVNDILVTSDSVFYNIEPMRFPNFSESAGFIKMPIYSNSIIGQITLSGLTKDSLNRYFYTNCSKEFELSTEGVAIGFPRKVFSPLIGRVVTNNSKYLKGEYLMLVFSKSFSLELENTTGYKTGTNNVIAVYRIINKPLSRI